ncbi:MAG: hypothetical protein HUU16_15965, partial [Candidatus Omnitrophica bacterium]|nr:hypothetical protein [Candidatus Omnitrophota bacterium]
MTRPDRKACRFPDIRPPSSALVLVLAFCASQSAPAQTALTYENWAEGFFTWNCLGCHHSSQHGEDRFGAPEGVNFDTLELIRQNESGIRDLALGDEPAMPPAGVVWWWD